MDFINLLSVSESKNNLSDDLFKNYLKHHGVKIKDDEVGGLLKLVVKFKKESKDINIFDGYYIGYTIPQISKEFDLLKITENSIINIELKSRSDEEKIKKQLIRNKYYLESLGKDYIYNIAYQSNEDKFYILKDRELNELEILDLIKILLAEYPIISDLDLLFNPSEFLVSPFNSTDKFIKNEYFLTSHQEEIKNNILGIIKVNTHGFCAVSGKAGTGKTLLVYDIAKEVMVSNRKVLVVHCGKLNDGHKELRNKHNVKIISASSFTQQIIKETYDLIIFDEAQRIRSQQLSIILKNKEKSNYLFSYDKTQTLSRSDGKYKGQIAGELYLKIKNHFELSENIRTNKEISSFIKRFVNKKENASQRKYKNITIQNFEDMNVVREYVNNLENNDWTYISYTNKIHGERGLYEKYNIISSDSKNAHDVIGQEFDRVIIIIGEKFIYKETGELTYNIHGDTSLPYLPHKMLFQAMTRVRKELKIIIVNNPEVLKRCIEILN